VQRIGHGGWRSCGRRPAVLRRGRVRWWCARGRPDAGSLRHRTAVPPRLPPCAPGEDVPRPLVRAVTGLPVRFYWAPPWWGRGCSSGGSPVMAGSVPVGVSVDADALPCARRAGATASQAHRRRRLG
jgi:hypothetical protein